MKKITEIKRQANVFLIRWKDGEEEKESAIYKHSDGSWHLDSTTYSLPEEDRRGLYEALVQFRTKPKKKKEKKEKKTQRRRAQVWFSE